MNPDFTGYVLAGGKSSRMGADKYSLAIDDETFLTRAVNVLKPVCGSVKLVLNQTQTIETNEPIVRDFFAERGALGAVHAALKTCATKFAIVLAVDLPRVSTESIENLKDIALPSNKYTAFVPRAIDGRPQPLCAVYRARFCLPTLEQLLNENASASARDFLELIAPKYVEQNRLSADPHLLFNVNYQADYEHIRSSTV